MEQFVATQGIDLVIREGPTEDDIAQQ